MDGLRLLRAEAQPSCRPLLVLNPFEMLLLIPYIDLSEQVVYDDLSLWTAGRCMSTHEVLVNGVHSESPLP